MSATGAHESRLTATLGVAIATFSAATFGFGTPFAVLAYKGGSNPQTVVLLRTAAFVVVVGVALALLRRITRLSRRGLIGSLWMAVTLIFVSLGYQGSVAFIPVSLAAVVFYSFPLFVGLIAIVARRDRMTSRKAAALVAAFVGLTLAFSPGFGALDWRGIALALLAALAMALTVSFGSEAMRDEDPVLMSLYTNVWMLVALAVAMTATNSIEFPATRPGMLGAIGLCLTYVIAYVCWYFALGLVRPVRLAALFNIEPLVTLLVAWFALGERMSVPQVIGAALVLASILSVTLSTPNDGGRRPIASSNL